MFRLLSARPEVLLLGTFGALIIAGGVLLSLPLCHAHGHSVSVLDAFFISASAVCVTGLITVDVPVVFNRTGHVVILLLFQLGGLGVMTFAAVVAQLLGRRVSFSSSAALEGVLFHEDAARNLRLAVVQIVLITFSAELIGALLIYRGLLDIGASDAPLFTAVFLAVSAFCNAGFSLYSDSLISVKHSNLVVWPIGVLIVVGGLGYIVVVEVLDRLRRRLLRRRETPVCWSLHTRISLTLSASLLAIGTLALWTLGAPSGGSWVRDLGDALFQSASGRTAGFNTVDIGALTTPALLILIALMVIGGCPASCAGGIKTTSAAVWLARVLSSLRGRADVELFGRRIPEDVVRRAALVIGLTAAWLVAGTMVLTITEQAGSGAFDLEDVLFEQVSAFGTVGLSTGVTPHLSPAGKLWIMLSMFVGRLGPLTVALAVLRSAQRPVFTYPREAVMIG